MYSERGYCHFGGHWSEALHRHTKSCKECEDVTLSALAARRPPMSPGNY